MGTATSSYTHVYEDGQLVRCSAGHEMTHYGRGGTGFGVCPHLWPDWTGDTSGIYSWPGDER